MTVEIVAANPLALALNWDGPVLAALGLRFSRDLPKPEPPSSEAGRALQRSLQGYVQGRGAAWPELPLALDRLSEFAGLVLRTLREKVPAGEVVSYGRLAAMAGRPGAARAVGRVMASNPYPLVIPCHRVVGSTGRLTGFSGAGLGMKRWLLELETGRCWG